MFHLNPQKLEGTIDASRFRQVVNIHSGYLQCDANYHVDVIYKGRSHPILMIYGLRTDKPTVYLDGSRIIIIEGCGLRTVNLEDGYSVDGLNTTLDILRAIRHDDKILICHLFGVTAYSADFDQELWSLTDENIKDVVWQDGQLLAFFSEHASVRLDPDTGEIIQIADENTQCATEGTDNVIRLETFFARRS